MNKALIKKIIFIGVILLYGCITIIGGATNAYMEYGGTGRMIGRYIFPMLGLSILTGFLIAYFFPKVFPNGWGTQKTAGKVAMVIVFFLFSFGLSISCFLLLNAKTGTRKNFMINGILVDKWMFKGRRGSRSYYIKVTDFDSNQTYTFRVNKHVYLNANFDGRLFSKEFTRGSLGVIYRKQE